MPDYSILKSKLADPAFAELTDKQIKAALNTKDIPAKTSVSTSRIKGYLQIVGKRIAVKDSTTLAGRTAETALNEFEVFDLSDPNYLNTLTTILDDLITEGLISATDKTVILSFGDSAISWADQNWSGDVTLTDIVNAKAYV